MKIGLKEFFPELGLEARVAVSTNPGDALGISAEFTKSALSPKEELRSEGVY